MLKYLLIENGMVADTKSCIALVSSPESKNLDDVISFMVSEGTGLTRPQALAYFEKLTQTIMYFVGQGHSVTTPLFRVRPTITGLFANKNDSFDASRHQINFRATAGLRLREQVPDIKLEKVKVSQQSPTPITFIDAFSGESNLTATSGGIGVLYGNLLRFDTNDVQQGVFFTPVDTSKNEVRADIYSGIKPSEIHFQIPNMQTGDYYLVVRALSRNGKVIRDGKLESVISV